jgi:hypothetical protein
VRVLDAFSGDPTPSPPTCNCNAPRFGFGLDPAFGGLLDGPLTDTVLAFVPLQLLYQLYLVL